MLISMFYTLASNEPSEANRLTSSYTEVTVIENETPIQLSALHSDAATGNADNENASYVIDVDAQEQSPDAATGTTVIIPEVIDSDAQEQSSDAAPVSPEEQSDSNRQAVFNAYYVSDQESLIRYKKHIQESFQKLMEDPLARQLIDNVILLSPDDLSLRFNQMAVTLRIWMQKRLCFRFNVAERALQLLEGVPDIERHNISTPESYRTYHYENIPTIIHFYVILWNSLNANLENWIKTWLIENSAYFGETFETMGVWLQNHLFLIDEIKYFLLNHTIDIVPPFIQHLCFQDMKINMKILRDLHQCYLEAKDFTPLIEALFMIMRGHNDTIEDPNERNKPACAEGCYLNIIREVIRTLGGAELYAQLANVTLQPCGYDASPPFMPSI